MRTALTRAILGLVLLAGLVAAAPAMAYDDGITKAELQNSSAGAVSRPWRIETRKVGEEDTARIFAEIQGFQINQAASRGKLIGTIDLIVESGLVIENREVRTNGPATDPEGVAHAGSWLVAVPTTAGLPVYIDLNTGFGPDGNPGAPGSKPGFGQLKIYVPPRSQLGNLRLVGLNLKLNTNGVGDPAEEVAITNPSAPGSYTIKTRFIPYNEGNSGPDPTVKVDKSVTVQVTPGGSVKPAVNVDTLTVPRSVSRKAGRVTVGVKGFGRITVTLFNSRRTKIASGIANITTKGGSKRVVLKFSKTLKPGRYSIVGRVGAKQKSKSITITK